MDLLASGNSDTFSSANEKLFSALRPQPGQLEMISRQALSSGIERYQSEDYEGAAKEFRRALGISPQSSYSAKTSDYLSSAYLKLGKNKEAIQTYKDAISRDPTEDAIRVKLGHLLFGLERYGEAEREYREAVRFNADPNSIFSLGQALMKLGRDSEAEDIFQKVKRMAPESGDGNYGLGQIYRKQGLNEKAIEEFKAAIELKEDFFYGYEELGYIYADMGMTEEAEEIVDYLEENSPSLAQTLKLYMYKVEPPKIGYIGFESTFPRFRGPMTQVSALDNYLENADASKQFNMVFQFTKEMDFSSVINLSNWTIDRSDKAGPAASYNFGMSVPSSEAEISSVPDNVTYDESLMQATVRFTIRQNSTVDATIDPSHIIFRFSGEDKYGNQMDLDGDEYSSFTKIV